MNPSNLARGAVALALFCGIHGHAVAQGADQYPSKPIRLVAPFAPGGGTDIVSRLVAQKLTERWGQSVIIDNRPGAGTMIGTELVKNSPADGYTLLIVAAAHSINPSLYRKVNYDPVRDFQPATMAVTFPFILVVNPSLPAQNVADLIALARSRPGKLTFASSGAGNTNHLAGELLKSMTSTDMIHVPYKGGGPALNDVLGGQITMLFSTILEAMPLVRAGKLKALAVTATKRGQFAPTVPTVAESGLPGFEVIGWYAFVAPAATPAPIMDKLNREMTAALSFPQVRERIIDLGAEPWPTSGVQAREFIAAEAARWGKLINQIGLKID